MRKAILTVAAGMIIILALESMALENNPFFGVWKLNTVKRKVPDPKMLPKAQIITSKGAKNGWVLVKSDIVDTEGNQYHAFWEGKYDIFV